MGGQASGAIIAVNPRAKSTPNGAPAPKTQNSALALVRKDDVNDKALQSLEFVQNPQKHNEMILEALSSIKDRDGSDFVSIMRFIEKKYEVPPNFRRLMSTKLRKLVIQGKVEKIQKRYKIKHASLGTKTPTPKQKVVRLKPKRESRPSISTEIEEASRTAAQKIAEAEDKSFLAAEAVKESERLSQMAEDADALVMHLIQLFEQWKDEPDNSKTKNSRAEAIFMV